MRSVDSVIIGGGVSGMACGKTLHEHGHDFVLLTRELGGRMLTSQSHLVNYGASYVTADYENILPFMAGGKRIRTSECYFFRDGRLISLFTLRTLRSSMALVRLLVKARDFRIRLKRLRRRALHEQQKDILASDPVLSALVRMPARMFVEELGLADLNDLFFAPLFNSTGFIEYDKSNAFHYLDNLMPLVCRTYVADHGHCAEEMARGWRPRIRLEEVQGLIPADGRGYLVQTTGGAYHAQNVVLALPYKDAIKVWPVPEPEHNVPVYVIELVGERRPVFRDKGIVFFRPEEHDITILWRQITGSDIVFSRRCDPALDQYYESHRIVSAVCWPTAAVLSGHDWAAQEMGKGMYLASDYNICGLEDAFITGVYAANRIIDGSQQGLTPGRASLTTE